MLLMIECSRTGRLISTGIETDVRSFEMLQTYCAYCRRYHRWSKEDACFDQITAEAVTH